MKHSKHFAMQSIVVTLSLMQPRILMAMSRDGLLPPLFSEVNRHTQVPVKSTVITGICAALLAFFMDVSQLAGMVRYVLEYFSPLLQAYAYCNAILFQGCKTKKRLCTLS